jgi:hypothetical protein
MLVFGWPRAMDSIVVHAEQFGMYDRQMMNGTDLTCMLILAHILYNFKISNVPEPLAGMDLSFGDLVKSVRNLVARALTAKQQLKVGVFLLACNIAQQQEGHQLEFEGWRAVVPANAQAITIFGLTFKNEEEKVIFL